MGDKGRQDPRKGGRAIQQRETRRCATADKGRQDPRKGAHHPTRGTGRGTGYNPRRGETRAWESGHTIQQRETRRGTMGDKGRQDPRQGGHTIQQGENKKGYNGRQRGTRPWGRRAHHPTKGIKKGYNGTQRETIPADTPSNKGKK